MKRKMAMALAAVLVAGSLPVTASAATFTDINEVSWASSTIQAVSDKGLINGYEDGTFRAKNNVTYSEAMVMIYNLMDKTGNLKARDVYKRQQLHLESAVGIYFRRGQTESFKAFMPMETLHHKKKWGRRRRLCEAKCLTPAPQKEMGTPKACLLYTSTAFLPFLFFIQHRTDSLFLLGTAIFICWKTPCPPKVWRRIRQMIL